ncbi:MAG: prepilin-type N-terminal cleavage/methylation domain-containing protein [Candidatus Eisenbacteria bacterium]|nr:prepilin-type N-terminal cleavage/methylation domain-containing protein [Candidatus Eisenbacteria bacterium]
MRIPEMQTVEYESSRRRDRDDRGRTRKRSVLKANGLHRAGAPEGFSLIEVIVVIAVMAVIASVAIPLSGVLMNRERGDSTVDEMTHLQDALTAYFEDHLQFPEDLQTLEDGAYVASAFSDGDAFTDAWGNAYIYEPETETATVTSLGEDQIDSDKNLTLTVTATPILRERTWDDMQTIHVALRGYEAERTTGGALPVLPAVWYDENPGSCAMGLLVEYGYLANQSRYVADAWGDPYIYEGSPADYVRSANLSGIGGPGGGG